MPHQDKIPTLNRASLGLACALALLGGASVQAAPDQEWSVYVNSPDSQALHMLSGEQSRMVADEFGGVRVLMLDGAGVAPTVLRSQAITADGDLVESTRVVAQDYLANGYAALDQSGEHYATSYSTIGGMMAKNWQIGDPLAQTALAFALSDAESIAALRVAANGDTLVARNAALSGKRTALVLERYSKGGKLNWSSMLGNKPAGAVALSEADNGQIALSYIANRLAFSARGGAVSSLINRLFDASGNERMHRSTALETDFVASSATISESGDSFLAVKSIGKNSSTCAMLAQPQRSDQVNVSFRVQALSCTAPAQVAANGDGFAAIFVADLGAGDEALLVSGSVSGKEWVRAIGSDEQARVRHQVARLDDGRVAFAVAMPNFRAVTGSMDLKVESVDADGRLDEIKLHPDLRHRDQFAISATADGGYVVAYSSYDNVESKSAVAVAKVRREIDGE